MSDWSVWYYISWWDKKQLESSITTKGSRFWWLERLLLTAFFRVQRLGMMSSVKRRTRDVVEMCCSLWFFWRGNVCTLMSILEWQVGNHFVWDSILFFFWFPPWFSVYILQAEQRLSVDYKLVAVFLRRETEEKKSVRRQPVSSMLRQLKYKLFPGCRYAYRCSLCALRRQVLHRSLKQLWKKWLTRVLASFVKIRSLSETRALS